MRHSSQHLVGNASVFSTEASDVVRIGGRGGRRYMKASLLSQWSPSLSCLHLNAHFQLDRGTEAEDLFFSLWVSFE